MSNLVTTVEEGVGDGSLLGSELFIFTDNSAAEGAFYKGNLPSRLLFELVLRLRKIEMGGEVRLWFIHVAGTRMIEQGTDGLSHGNLIEGVMGGKDMLSFVALHRGAMERGGERLLNWFRSWTEEDQLESLLPDEWFVKGHGIKGGERNLDGIWIPTVVEEGTFLWAPPPGAADVAVEELATARHKREMLRHIFVCPRLMTHLWRK